MSGHRHLGGPSLTQNQGNVLGERPCVRQSRLYREHNGGNTMKELMGQGDLKWDTTCVQGAYAGGKIFDHRKGEQENNEPIRGVCNQKHQHQQQQQQYCHTEDEDGAELDEEEAADHSFQHYGVNNNTAEHHPSQDVEAQDEYYGVVIEMDDGVEQGGGVDYRAEEKEEEAEKQPTEPIKKQIAPAGVRRGVMEPKAEAPTCQPVAYRSFRPGAGHANRQTYNIFTGE